MIARADPARRVWVVAHRGASRDRPENTLAAFDEALAQGCDAIELDLRLSADGIPVVFHDETLARAGRPDRSVEDLAAREIAGLDAGSSFDGRFRGEPVPTLQQVLDRYASRTRLLLELKSSRDEGRDRALAGATVRAAREAGAGEAVFILSFHGHLLEATAQQAPELRRVLNLKPPSRLGDGLRAVLPGLAALSVDVRGLTAAFGRELGEAGCPLWVWTCNSPEKVDRALEAGAVAVISDRPGWLAGRVREQGR